MKRLGDLVAAAWLGAALLTAAVVAPAAFDVLPARALAGDLVGRVLPVLFYGGALAAVFVWWTRRRANADGPKLVSGLVALWLASMLVAQLAVAPRIRSLREGAPVDTLPRADARRIALGRLHALSVGLLGVGMASALIVIIAGPRTVRPGSR